MIALKENEVETLRPNRQFKNAELDRREATGEDYVRTLK